MESDLRQRNNGATFEQSFANFRKSGLGATRSTLNASRADGLTFCGPYDCIYIVKDTYSIRELQRDTAGAVREAEAGALVTITRNDHPVVHVISAERLGALLETMELVSDPAFARELRKLLGGRQKFYPVSSLAD